MEIIIILGLVLLNGVFAMSEMALVSSRKYKLESAKKKGNVGAKTALELSENPTRFLSTVQIGITLIGILLGVYSGENLTSDITEYLSQYIWLQPYAKNIATLVLVVFITYLSIVLGELFPKRLGMFFPETLITILAGPMKILSLATSPFVWLLTKSNNFLIKLLGFEKMNERRVTEEEIKSLIKESAEDGEIQIIEQDIVERVFELGDRKVNSLFTHRLDIIYFKTTDTWEEIKLKIQEEKHSAYPVSTSNNLDDIIGIVLLKDLFIQVDQETFQILNFIRPPVWVNENTYAYKVLEIFKKEKMHYGIVVDEYGSTLGIISMDDVVDALVGDISDGEEDESRIVQRDENSWLVDGQFSIFEFDKIFNLDIEEYVEHKFTTVGGLVIYLSHKIPDVGEKVDIKDLILEVVDKDKQRIDKILVTKKEP
ncbi:MAG: hemolysin family protein [Saprospiraceae bacterium]